MYKYKGLFNTGKITEIIYFQPAVKQYINAGVKNMTRTRLLQFLRFSTVISE